MAAGPDNVREQAVGGATGALRTAAIDGHVHIQRAMPWEQIAANFSHAAPGHLPVCLIVECAGVDRFADLESQCDAWGPTGLQDRATGLHFIAGRQVVSAEGLEVLLIGSRDQTGEGMPADRIVGAGLDGGALVCLPWGFGKWLGARRALAADLLCRLSKRILLGDITNRPSFWPEPLFADQRVLRGSDNLPLPASSDNVGQFGTVLHAEQEITGAQDVLDLLRDPATPLIPYGKRKSAIDSLREQVRLRFSRGTG